MVLEEREGKIQICFPLRGATLKKRSSQFETIREYIYQKVTDVSEIPVQNRFSQLSTRRLLFLKLILTYCTIDF